MGKPKRSSPELRRIGLGITLAAALVYCVWLGAHWLPLSWSDKEMAGSASRVWDVHRELTEHGRVPWWTPYYMSGSSYALNHSRGFYVVPWLVLSAFTDLLTAGKSMMLAAIFLSAVAMYFCARHFLQSEWAAALAALAFMLHPEQLTRAATQEHVTISLFFPLIPMLWLTFARALKTCRAREAILCGMVVAIAMWVDNKQAFVQAVFLAGYLGYWLLRHRADRVWRAALRTCAGISVVTLIIGAFVLVPGVIESKYVKLFRGDPIESWQRSYSFKSLLALGDRDAVLTRAAIQGVTRHAQAQGYRPTSEAEARQLSAKIQRVLALQMDSPEKYAGVALLLMAAATCLFNRQRKDRHLFWFVVGMFLLCIMLANGLVNIWSANAETFGALFALDGVPSGCRTAALALIFGVAGFLVVLARRKFTAQWKWLAAGAALVAFLFLPGFALLAQLPVFKEIRAPGVFYSLPSAFFLAWVAGFFVTDVLNTDDRRALIPHWVFGLAVVMVIDYWPYQKSTTTTGIPAHTVENLKATYMTMRKDPDWVKAYALSGRYFHLLGPMYSGKPQVYEAFYNWMCPLGMGLLNQQGAGSLELFNLTGTRYIVFDKTDPSNQQNPNMQQLLDAYRKTYPVHLENDDFAVFRNDTANPYVTAYDQACLFVGDVRLSPKLALMLAGRGLPLIHAAQPSLGALDLDQLRGFVRIYTTSADYLTQPNVPDDLRLKIAYISQDSAPAIPETEGKRLALSDVKLVRENSGSVRITATAPAPCYAVIAESYYPFWQATVDGKPAELLRASCGLMGVNLPAGHHEIHLHYVPPRLYTVVALVSLLSLVIGIAAMIWLTTRRTV